MTVRGFRDAKLLPLHLAKIDLGLCRVLLSQLPRAADHTLCASHTLWGIHAVWTKSEVFKQHITQGTTANGAGRTLAKTPRFAKCQKAEVTSSPDIANQHCATNRGLDRRHFARTSWQGYRHP